MTNRQGAKWVEPGRGSTWVDLRTALDRMAFHRGSPDNNLKLWNLAWRRVQKRPAKLYYKTNLQLTGEILTWDDVQRIREAK